MAKRGNILYTDRDFTDLEVQQQFGFPVILILHDNNSVIKKISAFDENGAKSIYDFTLAASKDFVTATIATAISNIKDNTLEFPAFADFPQPGEVGNVYIDLEEDVLYIWDSASNSYISQSWNQTIITGIQTQITSLQNSKLNIPGALGHGQIGYWYNLYGNINNFMSSGMYVYGSNIGVGKENPEEKLDVNGNVKALKLLPNYYTYTSSFTKIEAINPTTKERALIDIPVVQNNIKKNLQSGNINYCGFAPFGSAEDAAVWTVTKITVAANGTATKQTFTNVTWSSVPF